jgi:hypothetical protein
MAQWQKVSGVPLDGPVRDAIDRAALDVGNAAALARKIGVTVGLMSQWRARNAARPVKVIPFPKWEKLYPHIRYYLPADARYHPGAAPAAARCQSCEEGEGQYQPRDTTPAAAPLVFQPPKRDTTTDDIIAALPPEAQARVAAAEAAGAEAARKEAAAAEAIRLFLETRKAAL